MSSIDQTEEGPRNLISLKEFEKKKYELQVELLKWQHHAKDNGEKHIIIFEGKDGAGKGGTIKRFMEHLNPKSARVVALDKPTESERTQWYWQRYIKELPKAGEITFWDRSWYNRATVERVMGFASQQEVDLFLHEAPLIEQMLKNNGFKIIKFWLDVSKKEQSRRFKERQSNPLKLGKMSPIDRVSQDKWNEYCEAENAIFAKTQDWIKIDSDCKRTARLACMSIVLNTYQYSGKSPLKGS